MKTWIFAFFFAPLAPFTLEVTGQENRPIVFDGTTFAADQDLTVKYRFNSYRLGDEVYTFSWFSYAVADYVLVL